MEQNNDKQLKRHSNPQKLWENINHLHAMPIEWVINATGPYKLHIHEL